MQTRKRQQLIDNILSQLDNMRKEDFATIEQYYDECIRLQSFLARECNYLAKELCGHIQQGEPGDCANCLQKGKCPLVNNEGNKNRFGICPRENNSGHNCLRISQDKREFLHRVYCN